MEKLLASYLLKNRNCPLPGIGSLQMHIDDSRYEASSQTLIAPRHCITLATQELDPDELISFIARKSDIPKAKAEEQLQNFCTDLKRLAKGDDHIYLPFAGRFLGGMFNKVQFQQDDHNDRYFPPLHAVAFAKDDHELLVGDRVTTSQAMTDYYAPATESKIRRWWLWPVILLIVASIAIAFYYFSGNRGFGSNRLLKPAQEQPTYTK